MARDLSARFEKAKFVVDVKSTGLFAVDPVLKKNGAVTGVKTSHGDIAAEVGCSFQYAQQVLRGLAEPLVVVTVEGERVIKVRGDADHPVSHGYTCEKGRALPQLHHGTERLVTAAAQVGARRYVYISGVGVAPDAQHLVKVSHQPACSWSEG